MRPSWRGASTLHSTYRQPLLFKFCLKSLQQYNGEFFIEKIRIRANLSRQYEIGGMKDNMFSTSSTANRIAHLHVVQSRACPDCGAVFLRMLK